MRRNEMRTRRCSHGERVFCRLEVQLCDEDRKGPELAICGSAGVILARDEATERALAYWTSFFEDNDSERMRLIDEREQYMSAEQAAQYVLDVDGQFHGLDVIDEDGDDVYVLTCCGQIRTELADFFPEVVPFFKYHLNHLNAACEHQEARGERYDTHGSVECLECGWKLGSGWQHRPLPAEVIRWAETGEGEPPAEAPVELGPQWIVHGSRTKRGALGRSEHFALNGGAESKRAAEEQARKILSERYEHVYVKGVEPWSPKRATGFRDVAEG